MDSRNHAVEEIWKKLKSAGPCHNVGNILLGEGASCADVTQRLDGGVYWPRSHHNVTKRKLRPIEPEITMPKRLVLTHITTQDQLEEALQRELQCVKNGTGQTRRAALETIKDVIGGFLGKVLLKRFDDSQEKCRLLAVDILHTLLQTATDAALPLLPYVLPVIMERMKTADGSKIPVEQSEDIRIKLLQLLHSVIDEAGSAIASYGTELKDTLEMGCNDAYCEVNMEACNILQLLNEKLGHRLHQVSKELVAMVMPLTTHKRQKVRIAAIKTVKVLMHQGAHEMILEITSFIDPNVVPIKAFYGESLKVNFLGKLATDPCPKVRLEFLLLISDWMLHLRERLDHESRLIPYALSALNDECPDVAFEAARLMDALGVQYEREHEEDLKDTLYYLPQEAHALGWGSQETIEGIWRMSHSAQTKTFLFHPFTHRPRLGTRILVQANFSRMVGAITAELVSWQSDIRTRTLELLRSCVVLIEDHVTMWLGPLLDGLRSVVRHDGVVPQLEDICFIMGCFVNTSKFLDHLMPIARDEDASSQTMMVAVRILALILEGSTRRADFAFHVPRLVDFLESPTFADIADIKLAVALFDVASAIAASASGDQCQQYGSRLAIILLQIAGGAVLRGQEPMVWLAKVESSLKALWTDAGDSPEKAARKCRSQLIEQVWTVQPSTELHSLIMAWTLLPFSQELMYFIVSADPTRQRSPQQISCKNASLTETECKTVLGHTKTALLCCITRPVAFSRLLLALIPALEASEVVPLDELDLHGLTNSIAEAAMETNDENCILGALRLMSLAADRSCLGEATPSECVAQTERFLLSCSKGASSVKSALCCTMEAALAGGTFLNPDDISMELVETVIHMLDDSRSIVRCNAERALASLLKKSEDWPVDGKVGDNRRKIVERIRGEVVTRMGAFGGSCSLNLIKGMVGGFPAT